MTTFILHGGFLSREKPSNEAMYRRIAEFMTDGGTVLVVQFASTYTEADDARTFEEFSSLLGSYGEGKEWRFVQASREHFISEAQEAACIIFRGGSTDQLIERLKAYPEFPQLLAGKMVIGSSAGAYALAAWGVSHEKNEIREGLGLVPVKVVCHYESDVLPPNADAVETLKESAPELPIVYLGDFDWQEFPV